jgi:ER membrane protein complex subunit 3
MVMFQAIGAVFAGFIIAQIPFPLGIKFKTMLQYGISVTALDPSYVSSMSW